MEARNSKIEKWKFEAGNWKREERKWKTGSELDSRVF
jgi:hypothetical protein